MILAFHCIISNYGFWLPNESRGSWSTFVANYELFYFGPATKVDTHRSVARQPYERRLKKEMQAALDREPVLFSGHHAKIVGQSLQNVPYAILALAIMKNHTHLVIGRTDRDIRRVVGHVKSEATRALHRAGHFADVSPWADHGWNVYLDSIEDVSRAIKYVEDNPLKDGLPRQNWSCVVPFAC